jgi:transcriptional regulator with XRE-family HTH domain
MASDINRAGNLSMPTEVDATFGARLRTLRQDAGVTQTQLADRLGIAANEIESQERGHTCINAQRLFELSRSLGVPLKEFAAVRCAPKSTWPDTMALVDQRRDQAMELVMSFYLIEDQPARAAILDFVKNLASTNADLSTDHLDGSRKPESTFVRLAELSRRYSDDRKPGSLEPEDSDTP